MRLVRILKKLLTLLLFIVMLPIPAVSAAEAKGVEKNESAVSEVSDTSSESEIDGTLRVYLKSLGTPLHLTLQLEGMYSIGETMRFSRGTRLRIAVEGESIWLESNGMSINMKDGFKLVRNASDGAENGIYIRQTPHNNIYIGDLEVFRDGSSLGIILYIDIEEYLYGVVPYEMNDSWPLEALKAQAIAARTYALARKSVRAEKRYDVVDTTGDQVFRGYNASYENAIEAVDSTRGIAGLYKDTFAVLYYGASNGGQTALPQDVLGYSGDYSYLDIRLDPYDLENPNSRVKSLDIYSDAALVDGTLITELLARAADEDEAVTDESTISSIDHIIPADPIGHEGSIMASSLIFGITVNIPDENGEKTEKKLEVKIGLFDFMKANYEDLKINSGKYEIYTVIAIGSDGKETPIAIGSEPYEGSKCFRIEARRFGHGVGMSQRGAQTMAGSHNMTSEEILSFYYPGVDFVTLNAVSPDPEELIPFASGLDRDVPGLLPILRNNEQYGRVVLPGDSYVLNIRKEASTTSDILGTLLDGQYVIITKKLEGWYHMRTAEQEGYVSSRYVIIN